jgi:excisionase family DNA binding protein
MRPEDEPLLYTPAESGAKLKVGRTKMAQLIASGEIRSVRIGRSRRIPADALTEYVERLQETA